MRFKSLLVLLAPAAVFAQADPWAQAEANGRQSQRAVQFCRRYAHGWLAQADPRSGLLPRTLKGDAFWNAKDCAADNYPFLALTARMTDDFYLKQAAEFIFAQERKLTCRVDNLPDDFVFSTQKFRGETYKLPDVIFGASEYAKDGLLPMTEWLGPGPWLDRTQELVQDVFKHATFDSPVGKLPSTDVEVIGDLLQASSRLYWATGNPDYREWVFRMADFYLLHHDLLADENLRLRDHGSEIVGGLTEACLIASREDAERWRKYRPRITAILDRILEIGINSDGMMYNAVNPRTGEIRIKGLADTWGYVYNGFLTISEIAGVPRYQAAATKALENLNKYRNYDWEAGSADGYADSIESALNLLNRLPNDTACSWVDSEISFLFNKQRPDGVLEAWYGDGNSARTAMMYACWKTQGITAAPWRDDLRLGAIRQADGSICITLAADWQWDGCLRFDRPRHRLNMHLPCDYPRINQFPEWFTVEPRGRYSIELGQETPKVVDGTTLYAYPLSLKPGSSVRVTVHRHEDPSRAPQHAMRYSHRPAGEAAAWQDGLRERLRALLKINDLSSDAIPLEPKLLKAEQRDGYTCQELQLRSSAGRTFNVVLTIPTAGAPLYPAVVCIHGHGGNRHVVYDPANIYRGFGSSLAASGYVTIAADVGQHEIYETGRTLIGERLWDLMRCVDYLHTLKQVDSGRIGCAGLSLGGEMAMWLGAMDTRIAATVSSGFLTRMDQMEQGHCGCWKLTGLRELVDFSDIYSLVAPRALQCQNGLAEPPGGFMVPLAREAMADIKTTYADLGRPENVELAIHREGHVVDLSSLTRFLDHNLKPAAR